MEALTEGALEVPALGGDPGSYVALLALLLSFEGVEVWGEQLDGLLGGEFELPCPGCETENFVVFGEHGYFSTLDDMYMNNAESERIPLRPADPASWKAWRSACTRGCSPTATPTSRTS